MKFDLECGPQSLGSCCRCGRDDSSVKNIKILELRSPEPGPGCWGCAVCNLPIAGAVAVLCEECIKKPGPPLQVCVGNPWENRRVPFSKLKQPFQHDWEKHKAFPTPDEEERIDEFAEKMAAAMIPQIIEQIFADMQRRIDRHGRN